MSRGPASVDSNEKGSQFEEVVEALLAAIAERHPDRVELDRHYSIALHDGRAKIVDFLFRYRTLSARNELCIECQHRNRYESTIIDKLLAIRANSKHNRFSYVYREDSFLSAEARAQLDAHGIMSFSLAHLREHLKAVGRDLRAAASATSPAALRYTPPADYAMAPPSPRIDWQRKLESRCDGTALNAAVHEVQMLLLKQVQKQCELDREVVLADRQRLEAERSTISQDLRWAAVKAIVWAVAGDSDADASLLEDLVGLVGVGDGAQSPIPENSSPESIRMRARDALLYAFCYGPPTGEAWNALLAIANEVVTRFAKSAPS